MTVTAEASALAAAYAEGDLVAAAALMDLLEESGVDEADFWAALADELEGVS